MIAVLSIARKYWPIVWPMLTVIIVLISLRFWGDYRENQGVLTERARCEKKAAAQLARREADLHRAETKDTAKRADTERKIAPVREKVVRYAKTAPDCLDTVGRSLLNEAIAATRASPSTASE